MWKDNAIIALAAFLKRKKRVRGERSLLHFQVTSLIMLTTPIFLFVLLFLCSIIGDDAYHADCFRCVQCESKIDDLVFAKTSQGIYCMVCHKERKEAKRQREQRERLERLVDEKSLPTIPEAEVKKQEPFFLVFLDAVRHLVSTHTSITCFDEHCIIMFAYVCTCACIHLIA